MREIIWKIPKSEFHIHVEGSLTAKRRLMLAQRNGIQLEHSTVEDMQKSYQFTDLTSFLKHYYSGMNVLLTEADFYDLAYDYFTMAHSQNVVYVEMFFDPQAATSRGVTFDTVVKGLRRAVEDARANMKLNVQMIMCFLRDHTPESAMKTLEASLPYKSWIVGVGLDSDERDHPPAQFLEVFTRARREGYKLTMHCDVHQPSSHEHIRQCLHMIQVDRIDHGINIAESQELISSVKGLDIGLTICPISNSLCTRGICEAEITMLLDAGVKVTINSDDPAYMGENYVYENLVKVAEVCNWTLKELVKVQQNGIDIAWVKEDERAELQRGLDAFVASCK